MATVEFVPTLLMISVDEEINLKTNLVYWTVYSNWHSIMNDVPSCLAFF